MTARRVFLVSALLAGLAIAVFAMRDMDSRPVRSVRVTGDLVHVVRPELERELGEHMVGGFFDFDVDTVRQATRALPWVRDASVRRVWPDSVHIAIVERKAVARWGDDALLEGNGTVFFPNPGREFDHLPRLSGPAGSHAHTVAYLIALQRELGVLDRRVTSVSLNERGAWRATLDDGVTLLLGQGNDMRGVRRFVHAFQTSLQSQLLNVERVDMRYANGFSIRWRQPPDEVAQETSG